MQTLSFSSPKLSVKNMVYLAMLMAMQLVLARFSVGNSFLRISPSFIATILMGYYLGPWLTAVGAALDDQITVLLIQPGADFFGFTVSAAVGGIIYGMFFHNKKVGVVRTVLAVALVTIIVNIGLNTFWLNMMGTPWQGVIWPRTLKNVITLPIQAALSYIILRAVERVHPRIN